MLVIQWTEHRAPARPPALRTSPARLNSLI